MKRIRKVAVFLAELVVIAAALILLVLGLATALNSDKFLLAFGPGTTGITSAQTPAAALQRPVQPVLTPQPVAIPAVNGWPETLFRSPVQRTAVFNQESSWLIAEPGVLLDNTTAWTVASVDTSYWANVPEGGFTFFSMGEGTIAIDGVDLALPGEEGLNYLVLVRGRIDDNIIDSDLNETARVADFVPGHAIWSHMPTGAYISKDWFREQLVASTTRGFTNCGATGCSRVRVVLFDVGSHFHQMFEVKAGTLNWTLLG